MFLFKLLLLFIPLMNDVFLGLTCATEAGKHLKNKKVIAA